MDRKKDRARREMVASMMMDTRRIVLSVLRRLDRLVDQYNTGEAPFYSSRTASMRVDWNDAGRALDRLEQLLDEEESRRLAAVETEVGRIIREIIEGSRPDGPP